MTKTILMFLVQFNTQSTKTVYLCKYNLVYRVILDIFWDLGFIFGYKKIKLSNNLKYFIIYPKKNKLNNKIFKKVIILSSSSKRKYISLKDLSILVEKEKGLSIFLLATVKGVLEANIAIKKKLGGELLCKITI